MSEQTAEPTVADLISEMRTVGMVGGQASVEGPETEASLIASFYTKRCFQWADRLEKLSREAEPRAQALKGGLLKEIHARWPQCYTQRTAPDAATTCRERYGDDYPMLCERCLFSAVLSSPDAAQEP